jgi:uncharacterized protein
MMRKTYSVTGMHCASCEAIIEKKAKSIDGVMGAKADMAGGTLTLTCEKNPPDPSQISALFQEGLYTFSDTPAESQPIPETVRVLGYAAGVIAFFFVLSASGLLQPLTIDSSSSSGAFFLFGLIAGLSTCAALVGSLVLALSTQWGSHTGDKDTIVGKLRPQMLFNAGRIAAYALAGALLGQLGASIRLSPDAGSLLVVAVSALMIVLALQMLGASPFNSIRLALPKRLVDKAGAGVRRNNLFSPFPTGFMTILLPCGFTMAAEGAAILSGSPWQGMAIMTFFVCGTMLPLLAIGLSSATLSSKPATSRVFMKTAGLLVIFFTLYNLNSQFGFAGRLAGSTPPAVTPKASATPGNPRIIRTVSSGGSLNATSFELRKGEKVRFIVDARDNGYGCMNAIMVPGLWNHPEYLVKGKPVVLEFTPTKPGAYQITCAMGMSWGVLNVK